MGREDCTYRFGTESCGGCEHFQDCFEDEIDKDDFIEALEDMCSDVSEIIEKW